MTLHRAHAEKRNPVIQVTCSCCVMKYIFEYQSDIPNAVLAQIATIYT